jgi:UDP-glucose 4-epimerase
VIRDANIVITGGAGFIGSTLATRLADHNRVVLFDNLHRDAVIGTPLLDHPNVKLIRGDVLDAAALGPVVESADIVVHMASIAGVDTVLKNPVLTMRVALLGTMNALEAAVRGGRCQRFVDFSTSEVFGRYAYKVTEGDATSLGAVGEARWTYAVSKLATEHLALSYHKQGNLPTVSVRPFNIYGPARSAKARCITSSRVPCAASRSSFTAMARRSDRGVISMTSSTVSSPPSPARKPSAMPSTSATRAAR